MSELPKLTRDQSMEAKPVSCVIDARSPLPDGGERLTVRVRSTGTQRWLLRAPEFVTRKFELDKVGIEVLAMCDGEKSVRYIVKKFAKEYKIDEHEAEKAVVTFLRMLIRKGLVAVMVRGA
jgi:hypothetical protein